LPDGEELPRLSNDLLQKLLPSVAVHEVALNGFSLLNSIMI
jgi:hypothetical protein